MAGPHAFPAPPDLSELFKFFATLSNDQPADQQQAPRRRRDGSDPTSHQSSTRIGSSGPHPSSQRQRTRFSTSQDPKTKAPLEFRKSHLPISSRRRESPPKSLPPPPSRASNLNDWNCSTQLPVTTAKPLKHQILDRTYQPPAPVVVDASGATHLVKRLSKTTVSSRLKRHQADDEAAALEAATATLVGAFERRGHHHHQSNKTSQHYGGLPGEDEQQDNTVSPSPSAPSDSRARDGIQTLLMYRREVENRLSRDPTRFPAPPFGDH